MLRKFLVYCKYYTYIDDIIFVKANNEEEALEIARLTLTYKNLIDDVYNLKIFNEIKEDSFITKEFIINKINNKKGE